MPEQDRSSSVSPRALILICIAAGTLMRLGISLVSQGSNDAATWERFGHQIADLGLIGAYRVEDTMNHPPLPLLWARFCILFGERARFAFFMKLPAILADAGAAALLAKIWFERHDFRHAKLACLAMAFSPVAILVSAYHCNTDNVYAFLTLLAMYLLGSRRCFFLGGLAIAAALNVKLVPILLVPIAFSLCRSRRDVLRLSAGIAMAIIPFAPLFLAPDLLLRNLLKYAPPLSEWGVPYFLEAAETHAPFAHAAGWIMSKYVWIGRWSILGVAVAMGIASAIWRRWSAFELAAIVYATMLVLAPGFGVQYAAIIVPSLLAVRIARSWVYGIMAGLFLLFIYWAYLMPGIWPLYSSFGGTFPMPGPLFGVLAWWVLAEMAAELVVHPGLNKQNVSARAS